MIDIDGIISKYEEICCEKTNLGLRAVINHYVEQRKVVLGGVAAETLAAIPESITRTMQDIILAPASHCCRAILQAARHQHCPLVLLAEPGARRSSEGKDK